MSEAISPSLSELSEFAKAYPLVSFRARDFLLQSGEVPHFFFFLKSGCVKMFTTSGGGANLTLHIFYPNSCFSLLSLVGKEKNGFDFQALTPVEAYRIPAEEFTRFVKEHGHISYELLQKLLLGTHGLLYRLQQSSFTAAYYQVAGVLMYFARHSEHATSSSPTLSLKVTHQDIADWLGLSRENVSVQMKKLERDGYISRQGRKITIGDIERFSKMVKEKSTSII